MGCDSSSAMIYQAGPLPADICVEYFPFYGRAESIKMMLAYHGVPFNEKNIEQKDWPAIKPNKDMFAYGSLPVTQVGHTRMGQARA